MENFFFKYPASLASRFRITFYRFLGMRIGKKNRLEGGRFRRAKNITIGYGNALSHGYQLWPIDEPSYVNRIAIGNHNYFNRSIMIDACGAITIGDYNMFGPDVYITDSNHTFGPGISPGKSKMNSGTVHIGNHCWIGAKVVILKDVSIGDYCVIGAGSVVTKSFPRGCVVAGVPAKLIRQNQVS